MSKVKLIFENVKSKLIFENLKPKLIFDITLPAAITGIFDFTFDSTFE